MPYALPYYSLSALPIGILGVYFLLTILKWLVKNAQILWSQRPQQADVAIQENTPSVEGVSKRDPGQNRLFRPDRTASTEAEGINDNSDSGRDSDSHDGTININKHPTDNYNTSKDANSKTDFRSSLPQGGDGTISNGISTRPTDRGTNNVSKRVYESSEIRTDTQGTQSLRDRGVGHKTTRATDKGHSAELRASQGEPTF